MQQIKRAFIAKHRLLELMNAKPWDATAFRLGEHWGALNRRAYLAAKAAHKNQRNNISNDTSNTLVHPKTNRMVADTPALRSN